MSTDPTAPGTPEPTPAAAPATPLADLPAPTGPAVTPAGGASSAPLTGAPDEITDGSAPHGGEPGWVTRHTSTLIGVMIGVIVAAVAIIGVGLYRHHQDSDNRDTEAAFTKNVAAQGATLETVQCHGDTCAAIINNQAYTVLVQKDAKGRQHFGVSAYTGR
jgi:hypothetical protein